MKFLFIFLVSFQLWAFPPTPDKTVSPGDLCTIENPDFKEMRYPEQIPYCKRNVTEERKVKIYEKYRIPKAERNQYTIDHIIPLSIGGSNSNKNLWPEHLTIKKARGTLEFDLYLALKNATMPQDVAIQTILDSKFQQKPE